MEPLEFGKFIVQLINLFWERLICCTVCDKGQAIIKKRLGYTIKWRTKAGLYWKIPFIDVLTRLIFERNTLNLTLIHFMSVKMSMEFLYRTIYW